MSADTSRLKPQLQPSEDLACGLHRLAMTEIAYACEQLDRPAAEADTAVHECRKAVKRLRALARLAKHRDAKAFRRVDRLLRRVGRTLAGQRDAVVAAATAAGLEPTIPAEEFVPVLRKSLKLDSSAQTPVARASKTLRKVRTRFDSLVSGGNAWESADLTAGMRAQYRRLRRDALYYLDTHSSEDAHQFRKSLQRHLAQLRVLDAADMAGFHDRIDALNEMSQLLGTHHDLAMLRELLRNARKRMPGPMRKSLRRAAKLRQRELDALIVEQIPALIEAEPERLVPEKPKSTGPGTPAPETIKEERVSIGGD